MTALNSVPVRRDDVYPGLEPVLVATAASVLLLPAAAAVGPGAPRAQCVLAPVVAAIEQVLPGGGPRATLTLDETAAVILRVLKLRLHCLHVEGSLVKFDGFG